ncbi:MAG: hypothetical protein HXY46_14140 [Syntrophaceae bacterium]|nr:hypothetical protein [Syntrophaceae bacterium]
MRRGDVCLLEILGKGCIHKKAEEKSVKYEESLFMLPSTNLPLYGFPLLRKKGANSKFIAEMSLPVQLNNPRLEGEGFYYFRRGHEIHLRRGL